MKMHLVKRPTFRTVIYLALLLMTVAGPSAAATAPKVSWRVELDSLLAEFHRQGVSPGLAAVVVKGGQVVFARGYGVERTGASAGMSADSSVGVGSLAKSFTAMAVMQLVEQGALELDAPVRRYLPWFSTADPEASGKITVRMLMSNSSGLPSQDQRWIWDFDPSPSAIERGVRALRSYRGSRAPGASFEYSNEGWNVLGVLIEHVGGLSYPEHLRTRILEPLGMARTSTAVEDFERLGALQGHWPDLERAVLAAPVYQGISMPAGSMLHASANDLGRYLMAMMNGGELDGQRVLSRDSVAEMWTPQVTMPGLAPEEGGDGGDMAYAMGWMVSEIDGRRVIHHAGASFSMASETFIDPATRSAVALLINTEPPDRYRYRTLPWLANNILHLVNGEPRSDFGLPRRPDPSLNAYVLPDRRTGAYLGRYVGSSGCVDIEAGGAEGLVATFTMGTYRQRLALDFVNPSKVLLRSYARTIWGKFRLGDRGAVLALELEGALQGVFGKSRPGPSGLLRHRSRDGRIEIPLPESWSVRWQDRRFSAHEPLNNGGTESTVALRGGVGLAGLFGEHRSVYSDLLPSSAAPSSELLAQHSEPVAGRLWRQLAWEEEHRGERLRRALYWTDHAEGACWFVLTVPRDRASTVVRDVVLPIMRGLRL